MRINSADVAIPSDPGGHWFARLPIGERLVEVEKMLAHLTDPDFAIYDYVDDQNPGWLRISFAVYEATDSMGHDLWDTWCEQLPHYDAAENGRKWSTFALSRPDRVTVGTLIRLARARGYQPPARALHPPMPPLADVLARFRPQPGDQT